MQALRIHSGPRNAQMNGRHVSRGHIKALSDGYVGGARRAFVKRDDGTRSYHYAHSYSRRCYKRRPVVERKLQPALAAQ